MNKVAIYGSCVTRDAFEFDDGGFDVKGKYFSRTSIASQISRPSNIILTDLDTDSQWIKWLIHTDFRKTFFEQLQEKDFDVLVIDLMTEKKGLLRTSQGIVTRSDDFVRANAKKQITGTVIPPFSYEAVKYFYRSIDCFCEKLLEVCENKLIIIHEAYQTDNIKSRFRHKRFDRSTINNNRIVNDFLRKYYQALFKRMPNSLSIRVDARYCLANREHRWGLSSSHYIDQYYYSFLEKLSLLCKVQ